VLRPEKRDSDRGERGIEGVEASKAEKKARRDGHCLHITTEWGKREEVVLTEWTALKIPSSNAGRGKGAGERRKKSR